MYVHTTNLPDSAEMSLQINNLSLKVLMKIFGNRRYGQFFHIMLNVILNVSLIVVQSLPNPKCRQLYLASLTVCWGEKQFHCCSNE